MKMHKYGQLESRVFYMEGRNRYIVDSFDSLNADYVKSISVFYLPLIGKRAATLYLQLVMERENRLDCTLERLCTLSHLNIDELEEALVILEKYELLKTYRREDEYLFLVRSPLSVRDFLNHEVYSRQYLNSVGEKEFEVSRRTYLPAVVQRTDYQDISHSFDPSVMSVWNQHDEDRYQKLQAANVIGDVDIDFDYGRFLRETSALILPMSLRTRDNMEAIGRLATVFAITPEKMRELVGRSVDHKTDTLDLEQLRKKCLACREADYVPGKNEFDVSPVAYLYNRQGAAVSQADKKMLENLMVEYHLDRQVINVLIDYVLNNTNNRLDRSYVDKIGATFMRQGIDTAAKAQAALSASSQPARSGKSKPVFSASAMEVSEQDINELRRELFGEEK